MALALGMTGQAFAAPVVLPGDERSRIEARARLEALRLNLQSYPSATTVLRVWCEDYGLAPEPRIRAIPVIGVDKPLRPEDRVALGAAPDEEVRYRRVQLACGERVLSEADNWYRPGQLTPEMIQALETTDTPFGAVVAPLRFTRRTLSSRLMFQPMADPPRRLFRRPAPNAPLIVPPHVLEHRAVLLKPDGTPFSLVVENYTGEVLAGQLRPDAEALAEDPAPAADAEARDAEAVE
ncbi:hypothetical protein ACFODL_14035 [Phenylobacterium terrae]|uniref:Uncharacterized protein n=1 Tax=Phenylobacterium terrae TaxID=2665495 RepID=A0ABW4N0L3_9CAUL